MRVGLKLCGILFLLAILLAIIVPVKAQRVYKPSSVLASGNWYKIAVKDEGVYKIDVPFLTGLGVNVSGLSSASIRLYGNGGAMLSEANADVPIDDLSENAIRVVDGGDGIFNGADYFLFYAPGTDRWLKDSLNRRFIHQQNIYSDSAYYFITIGGAGKRISTVSVTASPTATVNSFDERIFHELDTVNLLSGGKEWLGEEFANAPGKTLSRSFPVSIPGLVTSAPVTLISDCVARSVNVPSRFDVLLNGQVIQQVPVASVGPSIYDLYAQQAQQVSAIQIQQENFQLTYAYFPGGFNAQGWLNFFEIHARRNLAMPNKSLPFRDWNSVGNNVCEFVISNAGSDLQVWEITDPLAPVLMQGNFSVNEFRFRHDGSRLREYIAFQNSGLLIPKVMGRILNQDLHQTEKVDYLIITHPTLQTEAERLAAFHRQKNNLSVKVVTTTQVFHEFSSGIPDPTAIRDFVKMYYDRAASNPADRPDYLLLFGDASFDYKDRIKTNTNLAPAYQSKIFLDPLNTYTSDDYFGFLDDNEDINSGLVTNLLDIGIGRVPAKNITEAKNFVDKVTVYFDKNSLGAWRNNVTMIADDEDNNLHLQDAEFISSTAASANPLFNIQKIYLDAYPQQSTAGGTRYPAVNETINNKILNGTLMFNFTGHGGAARLAEEVILDQSIVNSWNNPNRLPLFITATCDFAPYDNPFIPSLGENILLRLRTGAIALMTTTRLVFSFSNRLMNNNYMRFALEPDVNGNYRSLGTAVKDAKNFTYQTSGDIINNRKFTLLGDPAMSLAFPGLKIKTTRVNGIDPATITDTLSAGEKAVIEGEITNYSGALLSVFNGTLSTVVYDKPQTVFTKGNDPASQVVGFQQQSNILFRGKTSVLNGKFKLEFIMPRDINYQFGNGKMSFYAEDGSLDGSDYFSQFMIGGSAAGTTTDKEGPEIKAWLNDEKFVNGSIVNQQPVLILKLADSSGINTSGSGIGHDISVTLDNDPGRVFILNEYYEADLDNYRQGRVRFQLPSFDPGIHTLHIKAWDVLNNSSETTLDFNVVNDESLVISHVLNYPNPFTTRTQFWFEHNKPGNDLYVQIHIYSPAGRVIKMLEKTINTPGNRSSDLEWDGRDEYGDKVGRGVYLYRIRVSSPGSKPCTVMEKLVVL